MDRQLLHDRLPGGHPARALLCLASVLTCLLAFVAELPAQSVPPATLGPISQQATPAPSTAPLGLRPADRPNPPANPSARRAAPAPAVSAYDREVEAANNHTVTLISGTVNGSYLQLANDFSFVLDEPGKMRVLPVVGRGGYENIYDVLLLRGIDLGLIRSDSLDFAKADGRVPDIAQRLAYIASLTNDEFHIVARNTFATIEDLRGKRVNFDLRGSGTNISGRNIFRKLGIEVQASNHDSGTAVAMMQRGEIDAAVFMSFKPIRWITLIPLGSDLRLIDVPYDPRLRDVYYPATIDASDYPNLVGAGTSVNTIAGKTLLITYNWQPGSERYQRVQRFTEAFFSKLELFQQGNRHPKWREVNITATFSGLPRFRPAAQWLERRALGQADQQATREQFLQFLNTRGSIAPAGQSGSDGERLFEEFLRWRDNRGR